MNSQERAAAREDIRAELRLTVRSRPSIAPHFIDYVMTRLEAEFGAAAVQQGGYHVYTTIDPTLQRLADRSVREGVSGLGSKGVNNGDLLAADPRTSRILAWVGSADHADNAIAGQYDAVFDLRQPGSSFKPYVYEAALKDHAITLCTIVHDQATAFPGGYAPLDFDNSYLGDLTARQALVLSRNIPAVEVAAKEGIGRVISLAHAMGVKSRLAPNLATAIGGSDVTMFDQVQGYQVLADRGRRMPLISITRIVGPDGSIVFEQRPGAQGGQAQVLSPAEAYLITDTLKAYQDQWHLGWSRQMASKSGTTGGSQAGVHPDAWMMAYDPGIVVGAWAGNTAPNGGGHPVGAFGVGRRQHRPRRVRRQPAGLTSQGGELFLPGTGPAQGGCQASGSGGGHGYGNGHDHGHSKKNDGGD